MAVQGTDFDNKIFRDRLLVDKILSGTYKTAIETLFTKTKVNEKGGTWLEYGLETNIKDGTELNPLYKVATTYGGTKTKTTFTLKWDSLSKGIPKVANMDDKMILEHQNDIFNTLADALYESIFKKTITELTKANTGVEENTETDIKAQGDTNIIDKIAKIAGNLSITANQIVMSQKTANRIMIESGLDQQFMFYKVGALNYEKLGEVIGTRVIALQDPRDLFKDKIFIMYKGVGEYVRETALRNFVYHGVEGFYEGEYARAYDDIKSGAKGGITCQLTVALDLKVVDKKLIKIIKLKTAS